MNTVISGSFGGQADPAAADSPQKAERAPGRAPWTFRGIPVPYITAWSGEERPLDESDKAVLRTGPRVAPRLVYFDELPADRDRHGILWRRVTSAPGQGRPLFASVHALRHRRVMSRGQCQICTAPAQVWMAAAGAWQAHLEKLGPDAPYLAADPPVCRACAATAAVRCPRLASEGHVFLAPRRWANIAVRGQVVDLASGDLGDLRLVPLPGAITTFERAEIALTVAHALYSGLFEVTAHTEVDEVAGLGVRLDR